MDHSGISNTNIARLFSIINDNYMSDGFSSFIQSNNILNSSLYDEAPIKNVASDKGKEQVKTVKYKKDCCSNNTCPILHIDFDDNEEIGVLPCNHGFNKEAIDRWISDEKAECPVCRFKLDSIEKKNTNAHNNEENNTHDNNSNIFSDIRDRTYAFDGHRNTVIYSHPFGPRIERVASIISEDDDHADLMTALNRVHSYNRSNINGLNITQIYSSPIFNVIQNQFDDISVNLHNPSLD